MQKAAALRRYRDKALNTGYLFFYSKALATAVKLDIFNRIGTGSKSPNELARATGTNERGIGLLLDALVGMGYLNKKGRRYSNTRYGREIFLRGKELYVGDILRFHETMWDGWSNLEESIRTGRPTRQTDMFQNEKEETRTFIMAMHNTAMGHVEKLASLVDLKGARTLLDIGGGSGAYSIFFCKANPHLKATVLDLPGTLEVTRDVISRSKMSRRISLQEGDFNKCLPRGFDVAFLSHIIHSLGEEGNMALMKKTYKALNPGGKIIIHDFILNEDKTRPSFASAFALCMLLFTEKGRTYSFGEIRGWLKASGFKSIKWPRLPLPRDISIVTACRS
ncbi:MAG: methyltransferase [Candidatus Brocadiales bacterium]